MYSSRLDEDSSILLETRKAWRWFNDNLLIALTLIGVTIGLVTGSVLRLHNPSDELVMLVSFPGEILVRMLKMLMLPLIVSSLIVGLSALNMEETGRMGRRTLVYYAFTTVVAVLVGVACVLIIHPGNPTSKGIDAGAGATGTGENVKAIDTMLDILRNLFPINIIRAAFQQTDTIYVPKEDARTSITTEKIRKIRYREGTNALGMMVMCIIFGVILGRMKKRATYVLDMMAAIHLNVTKLIYIVMWYSPIGITSLIAGKIMSTGNLQHRIAQLSMYILTVVLGLFLHSTVTLPLIYYIITRKNPFAFMKGLLQAWITALATSSSMATLPVTFRCLEEIHRIDKRVTRFVLPIGCTINMDGTALYETVGAIFIAQLNGIELGVDQIITISVIATLASVGVTSVPGPATVTMLLVLEAVDLPTGDIHLILSIDWFMDRLRTSVNVLGDAFGVGIVAHLSQKELSKRDIAKVSQIQIKEIVAILSHRDVSKLRHYPDKSIEMKKRSKDVKKPGVGMEERSEDAKKSVLEMEERSEDAKKPGVEMEERSEDAKKPAVEMEEKSDDGKKSVVVDSNQDLSGRGHITWCPEIGQE